jgi:hypothetical protein
LELIKRIKNVKKYLNETPSKIDADNKTMKKIVLTAIGNTLSIQTGNLTNKLINSIEILIIKKAMAMFKKREKLSNILSIKLLFTLFFIFITVFLK